MVDQAIERNIYFYWINAGRDPKTGRWKDFDVRPYLETIRQLAPGEDGLYLPIAKTSDHLICAVDDLGKRPKARWVRARRSDLPEVELEGKFDPLTIADKAGLADKCHVVFFDDNVVAAEFNTRAPRMPAFARYLIKKSDAPNIAIEHLLARDVLSKLQQLESIHMLDLRVADPQLPVLQDTPFHESFKSLMTKFDAWDVEVVLRRKRNSDEDLKGMKGILRKLARAAGRRGEGASPEKLKVKGRPIGGDEDAELDLLNSRLCSVQSIGRIRTRSRVLDAEDAYRAIEDAYKELSSDIKDAVSFRQVNDDRHGD